MEGLAAAELYGKPIHPYTAALLSAIPIPDPAEQLPTSVADAPEVGHFYRLVRPRSAQPL